MEVFTIGFTKKSAAQFFQTLKQAGIKRLIDVRLNNVSQLAGFAKREDLAYFLKELCGAEYIHEPLLAPTQEMLDEYKKKKGAWSDYEVQFLRLLADRKIEEQLPSSLFSGPAVLLCSELTPENCHRRLILDYLQTKGVDIQPVHL
jgi:uncharacterized protein (DUF488 family)